MARTSLLLLALALTLAAAGRERPDTALLHRIFDYAATVDTTRAADTAEYAYTRFRLSVDRKNPTLMLVPTVYAIAHSGQRQYVGETYSRITMPSFGRYESQQLLHVTTVPRRHRTMTTMLRYLTPHVYGETLFENALLSPFHRANRRFYRYRVTFLLNGTARVNFTPRRRNTQLVGGQALVDYYTGRIIRCSLIRHGQLLDHPANGRRGLAHATARPLRPAHALPLYPQQGERPLHGFLRPAPRVDRHHRQRGRHGADVPRAP